MRWAIAMVVLIDTGNALDAKVRFKVDLYGIGLIRVLMQSLQMVGVTGRMAVILVTFQMMLNSALMVLFSQTGLRILLCKSSNT